MSVAITYPCDLSSARGICLQYRREVVPAKSLYIPFISEGVQLSIILRCKVIAF